MNGKLPADLPSLNGQPAQACPKPNRFERQAEAQRAERKHRMTRAALRRYVYSHDERRCRRCHRALYLHLKDAPHELAVGHVHEWIFRSLGGDPLDPFNCLLLCATCHPLCQELKLLIVACDWKRLMRGPVEFIPNAPIVWVSAAS